jgi:hypothetical protein
MALLKDALKLEFPSFTLTESVVSGDPCLLVSADDSPAAGEEVAFIKMTQMAYTGFPTPSLASAEDGRAHLLQVVLEKSAGDALTSVWKSFDFARLIARLAQMNVLIQVYMRANATIPGNADIAVGNLSGEIRSDVRHPNAGD